MTRVLVGLMMVIALVFAVLGERAISAQALSVAPMPDPVSRYHLPLDRLGSTPASCHSLSSALLVPESSPREAKGAAASAIFLRASGADLSPAILAGSTAGPTMTKSLYITS